MSDDRGTETLLRAALEQHASTVEIAPDALGEIRARIRARRRARWIPGSARFRVSRGGTMFTLGGTGLAVAATVVAVMAGTGSCAPKAGPAEGIAPAASATATATAPATTSATTPAVTSSAMKNVPVYFTGATMHGPMLFREYHQLPVTGSSDAAAVSAALKQMIKPSGAYDPDYGSLWSSIRGMSVAGVSITNGVATVRLANVGTPSLKGSPVTAPAVAAVQQLVWTATAYTGGTGVKLLFDGSPKATLWGVPVSGVLHRAPAANTLAPVWIIDPQAESLSASPVTVHLAGIVFEATIGFKVLNSAGKVISDRSVNLSKGAPAQGTATVKVTLKPGQYTAVAYELSAKDGSLVASDTHTFTVK